MPRVGFEITTSEFERAKTVHSLDLVASGKLRNISGNWTVLQFLKVPPIATECLLLLLLLLFYYIIILYDDDDYYFI
jgi:hypothetical protein